MDVEPHRFLGIPVVTINQGLDSDENIKINKYLIGKHKECSCDALEGIEEKIKKHLDKLYAKHSNLQSVSSSCFKVKGNEIIETPCIVLYCSLKGYIPLEEEKFPECIENTPTDIREGYAVATGPADVNDPLGLGCSIGALGRGESGSLGVFTQNGIYQTGFISCAHVFFSYTDLKRNVENNRQELLIGEENVIRVRQPGGSIHDDSTDNVCGKVTSGWYGDISVIDPFTRKELDVTVDLATVQLTHRAPSVHLLRPEIDENIRNRSGKIKE
ncbi:hypothetical protein FSP39_005851 [Pinctada imbricata]|uniref:Uncharacterized protein n=1 Tax=Pinctada imbricata TaxID=66713 RepID=A0AA88XHD1_PINIB|nr:hypothetical protein FSP39_005851 [Pinctada imbricata]